MQNISNQLFDGFDLYKLTQRKFIVVLWVTLHFIFLLVNDKPILFQEWDAEDETLPPLASLVPPAITASAMFEPHE